MSTLFNTKQECFDYLNGMKDLTYHPTLKVFYPNGSYLLTHGEHSAPEFKPVYYPSMKVWGIYREVFYYSGTINAPTSGRVNMEADERGNYQIVPDFDY